MAKTVITVDNIGKKYRLGKSAGSTLADVARNSLDRLKGKASEQEKDFWALRHISFEVKEGEALGIIGRNGAGKSTLLKILSRITTPTEGRAIIRGRVSSLLEVGTGFHPELTGRENIFLNGTILGMSKSEVRQKFDEIVDFSGVERFLDTPVKHYSSGMYVRLAFAVAAHLEPEILVIDEVLAVGDAEFQKKCLGKMKDVAEAGRTVLFVSHSMPAVQTLCNKGLLLENGSLVLESKIEDVISNYINPKTNRNETNYKIEVEEGILEINNVSLGGLISGNSFKYQEEIIINIEIKSKLEVEYLDITLQIKASDGKILFPTSTVTQYESVLKSGINKLKCIIPGMFFNEGEYFVNLIVVTDRIKAIKKIEDIISFQVLPEQKPIGSFLSKAEGYLKPIFTWKNQN